MPSTLNLKNFAFHLYHSQDDPDSGEERTGDLTISTIIGIAFGSLLFILLVICFLVVSRARRRKATTLISPEDAFVKASFARWQSNVVGRRFQHHQRPGCQWSANDASAQRTTRLSASSPRTSFSSFSSDEKTWVDDEADLEDERHCGAHETGCNSRRPRSSRIDLPSSLPRAYIPR